VTHCIRAQLRQQIDPGDPGHIYVGNQAVDRKRNRITAELLCRAVGMSLHVVKLEQHFERPSKSRIVIDNMHNGLSHF